MHQFQVNSSSPCRLQIRATFPDPLTCLISIRMNYKYMNLITSVTTHTNRGYSPGTAIHELGGQESSSSELEQTTKATTIPVYLRSNAYSIPGTEETQCEGSVSAVYKSLCPRHSMKGEMRSSAGIPTGGTTRTLMSSEAWISSSSTRFSQRIVSLAPSGISNFRVISLPPVLTYRSLMNELRSCRRGALGLKN